MSNSEKTEHTDNKNSSEHMQETPIETVVTSENITEETAAISSNNAVATLMGLKNTHPNIFFGSIGGLVIVVIIIMMNMGGTNKMPHTSLKSFTIGQQYVLKGANSTSEGQSNISMASVPGVTAFDDSKETGVDQSCKQQPEGTVVKALDSQDFAGKKDAFIQVEVLSEGPCQGKKGWALAIDIQ